MYQMNRKEFQRLLKLASEQIPFGIYAIEKNDYAELMRERCESRSQLKQLRRNLKARGFKVYANGV